MRKIVSIAVGVVFVLAFTVVIAFAGSADSTKNITISKAEEGLFILAGGSKGEKREQGAGGTDSEMGTGGTETDMGTGGTGTPESGMGGEESGAGGAEDSGAGGSVPDSEKSGM